VRPAGRICLEVEVLYTPGKGKCQLNGKGVLGDRGSEGSCRQSAGSAALGKTANIVKARNLYGKRRRRSDGHKREGRCAIPGEIWTFAIVLPVLKGIGRNGQKSAEGIVGRATCRRPEHEGRE
jgi:hypothetical protein